MDLRIRPPASGEHRELTRIARAAKRHWGYPDEWLEEWQDALTVTERDLHELTVRCAETDGDVAGFYALSTGAGTVELEHLWVSPAEIGRGVGGRLFDHAVGEARARGARRLEIASDPNAVGFYEAQGATRVGSVPSTPAGRTLPLLVLDLD